MPAHSYEAGKLGRRKGKGAHRKPRKRSLNRTVAVGGAAVCIGVAYEVGGAPAADALSIVFATPGANGTGNTTQINILEGNIFDSQLRITGNNVSRNQTVGNTAIGLGNNAIVQLISDVWSRQIVIGGVAGHGNVTQINILSYNIVNPQLNVYGDNDSRNLSVGNVAIGNGNNSSAQAAPTAGFGLAWLGGTAGNGNTTQIALFSGNIFNPQFSLFGNNISDNAAVTNVAAGNGNGSQTDVASTGGLGTTLFGAHTGNGNTTQLAAFTSNIFNPQATFGGLNLSRNAAITNAASGNGNSSDNVVRSTGLFGNFTLFGTTGNGNSNQTAVGTGNIGNQQLRFGTGLRSGTVPRTGTDGGSGAEVRSRAPGSRLAAAVSRTLGLQRGTASTKSTDDSAPPRRPRLSGLGGRPTGGGPSDD